ncbi:MAG: hypothetical protein EBS01_02595 [Verrucomicrobia bacterium]|nr:hypothetical protein [Verrucomicrobiota bacterium]
MSTDPKSGIRDISFQRRTDGTFKKVRIVFGPHHFLELHAEADGKVDFWLGATHHGFRADATEVESELYKILEAVRAQFPENILDHTPFWEGRTRSL